ncbi:MAG: exodeoxyribonuclease III [Candidatus Magasanikbacteria bacterium]|nr:exodeoxyribonuclease III [Candidatus Magasanikbacteria bacterium]
MSSTVRIISWNVNGIRAVLRKECFTPFMTTHDPDILCLQETKAAKHQVEIDLPNYDEYWNSADKAGYSGTAIFTKEQPLSIHFGFLSGLEKKKKLLDDQGRAVSSEGRVITAEYKTFFLVNQYRPNAKHDLTRLRFIHKIWDPLFLSHCKALEKKKPVVICGDMNVAHEEIDLARPKDNIGNPGFTDEEREGFNALLNSGFTDTFRTLYPKKTGAYSWWSLRSGARKRNIGWRIDYVCVSKKLQPKIKKAFILPEIMGSDHCPVGVEMIV